MKRCPALAVCMIIFKFTIFDQEQLEAEACQAVELQIHVGFARDGIQDSDVIHCFTE